MNQRWQKGSCNLTMIVALDATPLIIPTGGVRRYVEELSRALSLQFPGDKFDLISDQLTRPRGWLERRWWLWGIQKEMRRRGIDIFHGTDSSVPYLPLRPSVMTLHDLAPWRSGGSARIRQRTPFLLRFGLATMVITPTEAVRKEAMDEFDLSADRVVAIPHAAPIWMRPVKIERGNGTNPYSGANPYFICVATIEKRKNIRMLVEAWRHLRKETNIDLVLAGRVTDPKEIPPVERGLRFLGSVNDRDLPTLYSGAVASLYPSTYEGFGLPVLEAMQCGAMVITSNDPAVRETGGNAAITIDADDTQGWFEAMRAALRNFQLVQEHRRLSLLRASEFTWKRTAQETHNVYLEAIQRFKSS